MSELLERREISSRELVSAHLDRIAQVDGRVRAFTTVFRERALADADRADAERAQGRARGALHGVPVSIKECFDIEGEATTLGIPGWRGRRAVRDAAIVELLREAGAVVLGRTNVSQTMLFAESRNPLFGQTANPFSLAHTPGGSSGGEAAAIAAGMSPLGIGTDIGGSVRIPAHFSGVAAIKPSLDRMAMRGYKTAVAGQEAVRGQGGPLARTTQDLALVMRALDPHRMSELDSRVPPIPWEEPSAIAVEKLRIGVFTDDGVLAPSAAVVRATERAAAVLRARGCEVVPFRPEGVWDMMGEYLSALSADGGVTLTSALRGGAVDSVLLPLKRMASVPARARMALARIARIAGEHRTARMLESLGNKSVAEYWRLTDKLRQFRFGLLDAMNRAQIDAIVCPASATPAYPHGMSKNFTLAASYTILWNAVQFPAGIVPVTRVRAGETSRPRAQDAVEKHAAKVDAQSRGLPVGAQVVARPWREATVLAVMEAIEAGVRGDADFPVTPVADI
jgi:fatty acid amide hydrolase